MRAISGGLVGISMIWGFLIAARRVVADRVTGRSLGQDVELIHTPQVIDVGGGLWRGAAPAAPGYAELADAGVTLVVDLRSEADSVAVRSLTDACGLQLLWLPTDNSHVPDPTHVTQLANAHGSAGGVTYVHCEAGEGRTGAIVGAYQVSEGRSTRLCVADALAIGSLTFSQLAYIVGAGQMPWLVKILGWTVDAPTEMLFDLVRPSVPSQHRQIASPSGKTPVVPAV